MIKLSNPFAEESSSRDTIVSLVIGAVFLLSLVMLWMWVNRDGDFFGGKSGPIWTELKPVKNQLSDGANASVKLILGSEKRGEAADLDSARQGLELTVAAVLSANSSESLRGASGIAHFQTEVTQALAVFADEHKLTAPQTVVVSELLIERQ